MCRVGDARLRSCPSLDIWEWSQPKGTDGDRVEQGRQMGVGQERCSAWLGNARGCVALWRAGRVFQEVLRCKMCTTIIIQKKCHGEYNIGNCTWGHDFTWSFSSSAVVLNNLVNERTASPSTQIKKHFLSIVPLHQAFNSTPFFQDNYHPQL